MCHRCTLQKVFITTSFSDTLVVHTKPTRHTEAEDNGDFNLRSLYNTTLRMRHSSQQRYSQAYMCSPMQCSNTSLDVGKYSSVLPDQEHKHNSVHFCSCQMDYIYFQVREICEKRSLLFELLDCFQELSLTELF